MSLLKLRLSRSGKCLLLFCWLSLPGPSGNAQEPNGSSPPAPTAAAPDAAWIVRDPSTGRLYRQQLVNVTVPTVQWESKPVTQTVYEPKLTTKNVAVQQTVYAPVTQYVMQPRLKGWWNPFRQPVTSYEFQPVTTWLPQNRAVNTPLTTQEWVPRQQTVYVPQAVQKMETQQQLVQTEIPQPGGLPVSAIAQQRPPLFRIPVLAQQRVLPWPPVNSGSLASSPDALANNGGLPVASPSPIAGLRPSSYAAPLRTASAVAGSQMRDQLQSGMSATVLR